MRSSVIEVVNMSWPTIVIVSSVLIIMRITLLIKSDRKSFVLHEELLNLNDDTHSFNKSIYTEAY